MNESLPLVWFVLVTTYLLTPVKGEHWWKTIIHARKDYESTNTFAYIFFIVYLVLKKIAFNLIVFVHFPCCTVCYLGCYLHTSLYVH